MSFKETEASVRYEMINGKKTAVITPECIITLTNTKTGKEYNSDAEAEADIIKDFSDGLDLIGLPETLSFADLSSIISS